MKTSDLDFDLPADRIATEPAEPRDSARLLVVRRGLGVLEHRTFRDLPDIDGAVREGDLMVFNETMVLPARFAGTRAATGGGVTGLYLASPAPGHWRVMLEAGGKLQVGETVALADAATLTLLEKHDRGIWLAKLDAADSTESLLTAIGHTPLPPYILKQRKAMHEPVDRPTDATRYNTVYAKQPGSVAAPTAGLHFTDALLQRLDAAGVRRATVTLHVGLGTFAPVRSDTLESHEIHREHIHIPAATMQAIRATRDAGGRVIPVGTTTVRALESLPMDWRDLATAGRDFTADTSLYILPGFEFRFTDALVTNFHLPQSTLLALVASLPGMTLPRLLDVYRQAIDHRYRFYSFGDAMLILE
jgi:S-adenosylmethionine:tRNA ribosyltransferase-isomerase